MLSLKSWLKNLQMAKDALFFSHDLNARNDKKIAALVREYKSAGYGVYWCAVEMMHEEGGILEIDELTFSAISHDLNEDIELVQAILLKCISCKLFCKADDNSLISKRVDKNLTKRQKISKIRSDAGKNGAIAKQEKSIEQQESANAKQNEAIAEQNQAEKERKKEREKENNNNSVENPEIGSDVVLSAAKQAWDDQKWREQVCMANYFKPDDLKQWMYMYNASLTGTTDIRDFTASKYKRMFNGWLQAKIKSGYKLPEKPKPQTNGLRTLTTDL